MKEIKKIEGFTPGPWHLSVPKSYGRWAGFNTAGGKCIGVYATNDDLEAIAQVAKDEMLQYKEQDHSANASLIAYAPELYSLALEQQDEINRLKGLLKKELHDKVIGEGFHEIAFTVRWLEYSRFNNL